MPLRYSSSSVMKWPRAEQVLPAAADWATRFARETEGVVAIGCYGSYAREDWGVGSDLDLVIVHEGVEGFEDGQARWGLETIPVPVEAVTYTLEQWFGLMSSNRRMARMLREEAIWFVGESELGLEEADR